ncbi:MULTISPECIES: glycosyltransferase family 4 protein [unclassified Paraflavitalea]|uniref:glycosyltransferase family 4 protein n=1 Tax=unclassified Paraflavitalea TaxID=2798305 RepID=UPI003D349BEC
MKLLVLNENYPHLENLMGNVFVHVRVKEYQKNHQVKVFSFFHKPRVINYEGVEISFFQESQALVKAIQEYKPDRIIVHFYHSWMLEELFKVVKVPYLIWVHGYEALGWYRRMFNYSWYSPVFFRFIKENTIQQLNLRKLIQYASSRDDIHFVFVSEWMKRITEEDTLSKVKRYSIIANPIDTDLFKYIPKTIEQRTRVLLLRSFHTRKYANDISVKAIQILSQRDVFKNFQFTLRGTGHLFKPLTEPLKKFDNVELIEGPVRQVLIPEVHKNYGVFLCPTRQDAQGVSMCEAMSSGLVPLASNNTAIPEYVKDRFSGLLSNSATELADHLELLYNSPDLFVDLSTNAAAEMRRICSMETVVSQELDVIVNP